MLALTPACNKKQPKVASQEDVKKMIELDDSIFEIEDDNTNEKCAKF